MTTLRRLLVLAILLGLALVSGSPLAPQVSAQAPSDAPVRLPGHTLSALPKATKVARAAQVAATDPMLTLTVVLNRTDEAGFQRFLTDVEDPKSANHGKFISQAEITKRFGPSQQAYDATLAFLQQQGFTLVEGSANRLTLTVKGARAQAEQAFSVHLDDYQLGSRSFYANDQDPAVPGNIAKNILAVAGLSNFAQPQPNTQGITSTKDCTFTTDISKAGFIPFCAFGFGFLHILWGLGCISHLTLDCQITGPSNTAAMRPAASGAGQKIGLLEYDTFDTADVSAYLNLIGAQAARINQLSAVAINGGVASPGPGEAEVLLDIDTVITGAPQANVVVYHAPGTTSFQSLFNAMVNDGDTVISNSWSYCEDQTSLADVQSIDAIFANASASGMSIFNASGDHGSTCLDGSANTVGVPADAPHATAVGGTTATIGPGLTYGGETWWDGSHASPQTGQGGFGTSRFFPRPTYQNGLTTTATRSVPD
nr:protease pro-enzyme activation domain-containing protein [Chloroflexota bacterium]